MPTLTIVVGAPGSGKSSIAGPLRAVTDRVVIDWDAFIPATELLTGRDLRASPDLWPPYRELVRAVIGELGDAPTVVLGVCTPDELAGWPDAQWILLDCDDDERRQRLIDRPAAEVDEALADAAEYRVLPFARIDTTARSPLDVAHSLADLMDDQ